MIVIICHDNRVACHIHVVRLSGESKVSGDARDSKILYPVHSFQVLSLYANEIHFLNAAMHFTILW
jgi:hypothetical protein